jgi:hypothetical protein
MAADFSPVRRLKEITMTMETARRVEEGWDRYRRTAVHRVERGIAWMLIAIGVGGLAATALWLWIESWTAADLPLTVRMAIGTVMVGGVLLIVSILRERWHLSRREPRSRQIER